MVKERDEARTRTRTLKFLFCTFHTPAPSAPAASWHDALVAAAQDADEEMPVPLAALPFLPRPRTPSPPITPVSSSSDVSRPLLTRFLSSRLWEQVAVALAHSLSKLS